MVGGKKTRSRGKGLMGSHQRCWLWGRNVVLELLRAGRWVPHEVLISERAGDEASRETVQHCEARGIPVVPSRDDDLRRLTGAEDHQGLAARMPPFPYLTTAELLRDWDRTRPLVILDRIQDPFNFGAIVRCGEVLGVGGMVVGEVSQADVSAQMVRSSAGAVHHVPLARTSSLAAFLSELSSLQVTVIGASERGSLAPDRLPRGTAVGLVIGNEGRGLAPEIVALCDDCVSIPQVGRVNSLNAAVAAGILLYELAKGTSGGRI